MKGKEKIQIYSIPDRVWHWIHGVSIFMLIITAIPIHFPSLRYMNLKVASNLHVIFGFIVIFDYFFWLIHMFLYGYIKNYALREEDKERMISQIRYYLFGIFKGEVNPFRGEPGNRLNPLQKMTYLLLMFVLMPIQGITGFILWNPIKNWKALSALGGIRIIAYIHSFIAFLFAAFIVLHLYLATTGITVFADYKAMLTGNVEE